MKYSVVVSAFNEAESVGELYQELLSALEPLGESFEILFVDDGSTDGTGEKLAELERRDRRVRLIRFVRNFGKSAAYSAAFRAAQGDVVVTLDADLQDDPAEVPKLLTKLDEGNDLVVGWKMQRLEHEPRKTIPSRVFNALLRWSFGLDLRDSNSGSRVMRRAVAQSLHLYGDMYRFIPQLAFSKGFRVAEEGVAHRKRKFGESKYGPRRFWTGLLDLLTLRFITRFSQRPLHFLGTIGLFDELFLNLKQGQNDLRIAVTEDFGGWGLLGQLDRMNSAARRGRRCRRELRTRPALPCPRVRCTRAWCGPGR